MSLLSPIAALGRVTLSGLAQVGRITLYAAATLAHLVRPPFYPREFLSALLNVGWLSLPVVGLTALFTGGALALQIYAGGQRFSAEAVVPQIVAIGMVRELGPVLVGLMIAARVTSSIAAEIATMKVTEQIDALVTLSTHPMKYLTVPRVLAGFLTVPLLVGVGDIIGILGGFTVATGQLGFNKASYIQNTVDFLELPDVVSSLIKGAFFGFIATLVGCYHGMNSGRGAMGVGQATKNAVAMASILILAANFLLTSVLFGS
ncbi:MlaE family ABC transporter permease [Neogemmobacter tilapiae]|uniref:ABC transporter permease n=1 Tax=Neogemmobacter tilapiae TaxID=875041 RepID=A0A918TT36_9RHOB|nr:ABC transporter permease [Gemmobacter tilapiae]GHC57833.1 ABC transporter permease [Gemmobacter tilapiae]